ncbi:VRR-NUC domain-containing protein [Thermodesulfovibrio thiophilus]|uniref:VRR-NUC domain-containing protein n=1 Tax=Thermodesulfovibrio thiophilus TaxID=340095 RepID=UPI0003F83534|nr:VRR-NUC domain-containing protein [Thermodesulfovibrio thiophilus]
MPLCLLDKNIRKQRRKSVKKPEAMLVSSCMEYLSIRGAQVIRNNTGLLFIKDKNGKSRAIKTGSPGSPDLIAFLPEGRVLCIECKSKKGKLSDLQKAFIEKMRKNKHEVVVIRSLEDLMEVV